MMQDTTSREAAQHAFIESVHGFRCQVKSDVDIDAGWWTVPSTSSKNKLTHRVPLNTSAVVILKALLPDPSTKTASPYVLHGSRGKRQQSAAAATFKVPDFRGHDLRRTAASYMASGGIPRLTISKILNHVERSVTAVYDRHSYDAEKLRRWRGGITN